MPILHDAQFIYTVWYGYIYSLSLTRDDVGGMSHLVTLGRLVCNATTLRDFIFPRIFLHQK